MENICETDQQYQEYKYYLHWDEGPFFHIHAYFVSCHHEIEPCLVCWPEVLQYLDNINLSG